MRIQLYFLLGFTFFGGALILNAQSVEFTRTLRFGDLGEDVLLLQQILNTNSATRVASVGDGSPGAETTYFGNRTRLAVLRFQEKYASEILTPAGLTAPTGVVGSYTRAKLSAIRGQLFPDQFSPTPIFPSETPLQPAPPGPTPSPSTPGGVTYGLNVYRAGAGDVSAADIFCGSDCFEDYLAGTMVTLRAVAHAGYTFSFWSGDCSGTGSCVLMMDRSHVVAATFRESILNTTLPPIVPPSIMPLPITPPIFPPPIAPAPVTPPPVLPPPIVLPPITPPPPAPTVTLTASPFSVTTGMASTLTWSTANTVSCSASGGWTGTKAVSGSQTTGALSATTAFSISCSGTGGSLTRSVTVSVNPPVAPPPPAGYTAAQVALHNVKTDCWYYISGKVYNITAFFGNHKGGDSRLLAYCGKDAYKGFYQDFNHSSLARTKLNTYEIGPLIAMAVPNTAVATVITSLRSPIELSVVAASPYHINLLWSRDLGAVDYVIYRNGVELGIVSGQAYTDSALTPYTRYVYTVGSRSSSHAIRGMSLSEQVMTPSIRACEPSKLGVIPCAILVHYPGARLWSQNITENGAATLRIFSSTGQCRVIETNTSGGMVSDNICSNG